MVLEREVPEAVPAATVILLREGDTGMEVLLLRRSARADYLAEAWVFPGGGVEPEDGADPLSLETARAAASREAREEAGIVLDSGALVPYSQWRPPPQSPKRFLTWFFVAEAPHHGEVTVDGAEITEHVWITPAKGLAARDAGEVTLVPSTWMTLRELSNQHSTASVLDTARGRTPPYWETRLSFVPREDDPEKNDVIALWEGDAGYPSSDATASGARHRLHMGAAPWFYDRSEGVRGPADPAM
jgi:8-oxo-dGTP pyrophosphatase MutT (NUDIX family)